MITQEAIATMSPFSVPSQGGEAHWWFASLAEVKATAAQTAGQLSIVEITEPPDAAAPLHVHYREDEAFYVLAGSITVEVGGTSLPLKPGDFAFAPRGIPHRYDVGSDGCRMLFILTPGGFEEIVRGMGVPAGARTLPPPVQEEPDWERVAAVAQAHGCALLG